MGEFAITCKGCCHRSLRQPIRLHQDGTELENALPRAALAARALFRLDRKPEPPTAPSRRRQLIRRQSKPREVSREASIIRISFPTSLTRRGNSRGAERHAEFERLPERAEPGT